MIGASVFRWPATAFWRRWRGDGRVWAEVTPFCAFSAGIRKIIYTTNAVEWLNRVLRKTLKTKGSFPTDSTQHHLLSVDALRHDLRCEANGIEHRLTNPNHPWTNGQVERMNRTVKDATVKRFHYDSYDQLRTHLAYNVARRLKTLSGLTPYEYICKIWTSEPERFILNPIHQMPGLNRPKPGALATPETGSYQTQGLSL